MPRDCESRTPLVAKIVLGHAVTDLAVHAGVRNGRSCWPNRASYSLWFKGKDVALSLHCKTFSTS